MDTGQRPGPDGLRTGALVGPGKMARAFGLDPVGKDRFHIFFPKLFSSAKQIQKNPENV
jgi:hypothetical protein